MQAADLDGAVRDRRLHPLAAARGAGRHRSDAAARRRITEFEAARPGADLNPTLNRAGGNPRLHGPKWWTLRSTLFTVCAHEQVPARGRPGRPPRRPETAATAVDALLQIVVDTVRSGDTVSLAGFGVFESRARAARTGRNPRIGESRRGAGDDGARVPPGHGIPQRGRRVTTPRTSPSRPTPAVEDAPRPGSGPAAPSTPCRVGDERLGRRRVAQRCRRPERGAHHDAARRTPCGR